MLKTVSYFLESYFVYIPTRHRRHIRGFCRCVESP
jgi:hypothetical protein